VVQLILHKFTGYNEIGTLVDKTTISKYGCKDISNKTTISR